MDLQGYIPVSSNLEVAAAAVRLVLAGGSYFPRPQNVEPRHGEVLPSYQHPAVDPARIAELTSRERAVLGLLASGMPNKVIAHRLGMSLSTVKAHVHHIIRKLQVGNRTEVALLTRRMHADMAEAAKVSVPPIVMAPTSRSGIRTDIGVQDTSVEQRAEDLS